MFFFQPSDRRTVDDVLAATIGEPSKNVKQVNHRVAKSDATNQKLATERAGSPMRQRYKAPPAGFMIPQFADEMAAKGYILWFSTKTRMWITERGPATAEMANTHVSNADMQQTAAAAGFAAPQGPPPHDSLSPSTSESPDKSQH